MKQLIISKKQLKGQKGATMLEYGIIVALIVVGAIAFLPGIGEQISAAFEALETAVTPE